MSVLRMLGYFTEVGEWICAACLGCLAGLASLVDASSNVGPGLVWFGWMWVCSFFVFWGFFIFVLGFRRELRGGKVVWGLNGMMERNGISGLGLVGAFCDYLIAMAVCSFYFTSPYLALIPTFCTLGGL